MKFNTIANHGGKHDDSGMRAVNYPIYLSATFAQPDSDTQGEYGYSRGNNPTRASAEQLAAALEGAQFAIAAGSGMAATSIVFELLQSGDRVLINTNVYGGTWRFVSNLFDSRGINYEIVNDFNTYDFANAPKDTRMVFIETPSNPLLEITDIARVAEEAHKINALVVVDNTFMTSYLQKPLSLGADIVVYSATKFYSGHSDVLAGLVLTNDAARNERMRFINNTLGGVLSPIDAFLLQRGIKTLGIRMEREQENAQKIAEYLNAHPAVTKVYYPGLPDHKNREIQERQAEGAGAVLSFLFNEETYDLKTFVGALTLFPFAVSLGGTVSLICRPSTMTHESYSPELQKEIGIVPNLLRISAGIEDAEDLIGDLDQALRKAKK